MPLTSGQKAAVLFMSLHPEISAELFSELEAGVVQAVTLEIAELPHITPAVRESVVAEFMDGVGLGIPGLTLEDAGLLSVLEFFVQNHPLTAAQRLSRMWLGELKAFSPIGKLVRFSEDEPGFALTGGYQKAAMFMQSLPLPLAIMLLGSFCQDKRSPLMQSMEKLGSLSIKSPISEAAWVELMAPEAIGDGLDVELLWEALEEMIRNEPEVVVDRMRKRWLET